MKNLLLMPLMGGALMMSVFADGGCSGTGARVCAVGTECVEQEPAGDYEGHDDYWNVTDDDYYGYGSIFSPSICVPVSCEAPRACPGGWICEPAEVTCDAAPCPQFACVPSN